jgi:hypothetical protein
MGHVCSHPHAISVQCTSRIRQGRGGRSRGGGVAGHGRDSRSARRRRHPRSPGAPCDHGHHVAAGGQPAPPAAAYPELLAAGDAPARGGGGRGRRGARRSARRSPRHDRQGKRPGTRGRWPEKTWGTPASRPYPYTSDTSNPLGRLGASFLADSALGLLARNAQLIDQMKPRKKHPQEKARHPPRSVPRVPPKALPPMPVDWSEPVELEGPRYDVERDRVPTEVGPDEPEVDQRLEH